MGIINLISEKIILPSSDIVTQSSLYEHFKFLDKSQWWAKEKLIEYQNFKLKKLIKHSFSTVPYYKNLFKTEGININDIHTIDDLPIIPILDKSVIKQEGIEQFSSNSIPSDQIVKSSSSGSTGEPLFYLNTKNAYSLNKAAYLRGWYWMGYRLGDKYVKLSQNKRDKPIKRFQDLATRNLYLSTNPLNNKNFHFILNEIEKYKPKVIRCYPDPLLFLSRYKKELKQVFSYHPQAINTTGNTLHPETRDEIESVFKCKIFDSYNCEGNSIVYECPTHDCYHSAMEYGISEIIDEEGNKVNNGVGKLITTDFSNFAHPFIRYDTQDIVEVSDEPCICGRHLLRINKIIGRDNDVLEAPSGMKFIVHNFTGFFQVDDPNIKRSIDRFQIVKKNDNTFLFKLITNKNYDINVENYIKNYWSNKFEAPVVIEEVNEIPLTNSGKRKFIIKE